MIEKENSKDILAANIAGKKSTGTLEPISHARANKTSMKNYLPNSVENKKEPQSQNNVNMKSNHPYRTIEAAIVFLTLLVVRRKVFSNFKMENRIVNNAHNSSRIEHSLYQLARV